jgi:hypothetical protein
MRVLFAVALALHFATPASAQPGCAPAPRPGACLIEFNHADAAWQLETKLADWRIDADVNGRPVVTIADTNGCQVVVTQTNPLLYAVTLGEITEKDTGLLADVGKLATLLGGNLTGLASLAATRATLHATDDPVAQAFSDLEAKTRELQAALLALADLHVRTVSALNLAETVPDPTLPTLWTRSPAQSPEEPDPDRLDGAWWIERYDGLRRRRREALDALGGTTPKGSRESVLEAVAGVLDTQAATAKLVSALAAVRDRWYDYVKDGHLCRRLPVPLRPRDVSWKKDQIHAFTVDADSPLAASVARRLPKVETSVRFTSPRASQFGVGVGLVYTPLEEVTYKAVKDAAGVTRITAVERDARAGQLGLFVDWRFVQALHPPATAWRLKPGLQGGVALDTDAPGFFLGGSLHLVKWVRVSGGYTWQSVAVLDGQAPGDPVEDGDAIRTRDRLRGRWYVGLSLAIDDLPLFSAK